MRRLLTAGVLLMLANTTLFAQDSLPPVIKPDEILADSVALVETLPLLNIDDSTRTLYYFDPTANEWSAHNYPDGLEAIEDVRYYTRQRSDGTYIINSSSFWPFSQALADEAWIFNPADGRFSHPEVACGLVRALPGEGAWVITEDEKTGLDYLCFIETGELSPSIPETTFAIPCSYQRWKPVATSLDSRWVLVFCTGIEFVVYSYDTQMQQFLYLGRSTGDENHTLEVVRWLTGTEAILRNNPSWSPLSNAYYVVDVTRSESLEFIVDDVYGAPRYYDEPPHLEWMPCEFASCGPGPRAGGLRYYDFTTHEFIGYPHIERVDGVGDVIPDGSGDRLYRSLNYNDNYLAPSATLIRFNYETQEISEVYTGEVEWVEGFSPDGRHVVLCVGRDGGIASNSLLANNQAGYAPDISAALVLLDLQPNRVIEKAFADVHPPCTHDPFFTFGNEPQTLTWLDADTFFVSGGNGSDLVVTLGEGVEVEAELESVETASLSPDNQRILVWDKLGEVNVYNIATGESAPIFQSSPLDQYALLVSWQSASELIVTVVESTGEDSIRELARWRVRAPL